MKEKMSISVREFFKQFPTDESCLNHLFDIRFGQKYSCPKCTRQTKWFRIKAERAYSCQFCGHHLHPTVGTPFESSRTPLQVWFYAIYLFTTSRHGVSGKELQRQLGVTYKCAYRMGQEIRKHMAEVDGEHELYGVVEVDETLIGGKRHGGKRGRGAEGKTIVFGMLQRDGEVMTRIVDDAKAKTLIPLIQDNVAEGTTVHSDEHCGYTRVRFLGYKHEVVNHSAKEYVRGNCHVNGLENYWKLLKSSIKSTHIHVSKKHLEKYAKEFEFRYNNRKAPKQMFPKLVSSFVKP
jgi:transposase-like protein